MGTLDDCERSLDMLRSAHCQVLTKACNCCSYFRGFSIGRRHQMKFAEAVDGGLKRGEAPYPFSETHDKSKVKCMLCTARNDNRGLREYFVRNYAAPPESAEGGSGWSMRDATMATSAAPTVFKPHARLDDAAGVDRGAEFLDGGLYNNDPTLATITEALLVFPGRPIKCVHSIGTHAEHQKKKQHNKSCCPFLGWVNEIVSIAMLESSPVQGRAALQLKMKYPDATLTRVAPPTDECDPFETKDEPIMHMQELCAGYIKENQHLFDTIAAELMDDTAIKPMEEKVLTL